MSKRVFDILPPHPKDEPRSHHNNGSNKKEKGSFHTFFIFIFGLIFIFILFRFSKMENLNLNTNSSTNNSNKNQFELFNTQGQSNLTNNQIISVNILDGATNPLNESLAENLLLKAGFEIAKKDKAPSIINQTIIYYKKGQLTVAKQAADALSANFLPTTQESSSLESTYDLQIIVGNQ